MRIERIHIVGYLVTLNIDDDWIEQIRETIPELLYEKQKKFVE